MLLALHWYTWPIEQNTYCHPPIIMGQKSGHFNVAFLMIEFNGGVANYKLNVSW